jgi:hypothetical protein
MKPLRLTLALLIVLLATVGTAAADNNRNFVAHLSGDEEVPSVATLAQGQAIFHLSKDGSALHFKLIVANIENVTQAHIHCGAVGVNGPIVVFLYGFGPVVSPDGILSEGTVTGANVIPLSPSAACPGGVANFADLIAKMQTGGAYVNAHTTGHPAGEIRGQIH